MARSEKPLKSHQQSQNRTQSNSHWEIRKFRDGFRGKRQNASLSCRGAWSTSWFNQRIANLLRIYEFMKPAVRRNDLLYPKESYQIVGAAYDVYNILGSGHHEKYYQRALAEELKKRELEFLEQAHYPLRYGQKVI